MLPPAKQRIAWIKSEVVPSSIQSSHKWAQTDPTTQNYPYCTSRLAAFDRRSLDCLLWLLLRGWSFQLLQKPLTPIQRDVYRTINPIITCEVQKPYFFLTTTLHLVVIAFASKILWKNRMRKIILRPKHALRSFCCSLPSRGARFCSSHSDHTQNNIQQLIKLK